MISWGQQGTFNAYLRLVLYATLHKRQDQFFNMFYKNGRHFLKGCEAIIF